MTTRMKFKRHFKNDWLLKAAKHKFVDYPWLEEEIKNLAWCNVRDKDTTYFVCPWKRNEGFEWQDQERILLENTEKGPIEILVIQNNRIGGFSFVEIQLDYYFNDLEFYKERILDMWVEHELPYLREKYPEHLWKGRYEQAIEACSETVKISV